MSTEAALAACNQHKTELVRFYCEQCKTLICDDCVVGKHMQCNKLKLGEYGRKLENSLKETVKRSSETGIPYIRNILEQAEKTKRSFNDSVDKEIESVKSKTEEIRNIFLNLEEELIKSFEDAREAAMGEFEKFTQQYKQKQNKMEEILKNIREKGPELATTEVAVYESVLNDLLRFDPSLDKIPKIEHPKHKFHEEFFQKENVRNMIGFLNYGNYDLPSPCLTIENRSKSQVDNQTIHSVTLSDKTISSTDENQSGGLIESDKERLEQIRQSQITPPQYSETSSDFYGPVQNAQSYVSVKSYKLNSNVTQIVPKDKCRQAWVIGDTIGELNLSGDKPKYETLISSFEGQVIAASKSQGNELLVLINGQTSIKKLQTIPKMFGRGRNYKLESHIYFESNQLLTMCTPSSSKIEIITCLKDGPSSGSKDIRIRLNWYYSVKSKTRELCLSSVDVDIDNPIHLSESPDGELCITCSPNNSSSWIILLDRDGKQKMRYPPKNVKPTPSNSYHSFIGSGFLSDGNITVLDKKQYRQHLINPTGEQIQSDTYDNSPCCLAVDEYDNVWVGFENGNIQIMNYNASYETYKKK